MNILYISHLTRTASEGPNYSVPAQIKAQSRLDHVFWYNMTEAVQPHWLETGLFHGIAEFPSKRLKDLPEPFCHPDLVVFESFYYIDDIAFSAQCRKNGIPYIIIPRSALTKKGQNQKRLKKWVANLLLFKRMTRGAAAIQYLTEDEKRDSGNRWNRNAFVIPNGIEPAPQVKTWTTPGLKGVYIGRMDPYQKGLDLLIEACTVLREEMLEAGFQVNLHGPERMGWREKLRQEIQEKKLDGVLHIKDGVFGEEKKAVLLNADFFIMTSRFEGHPMSMIEALSYGLPVFATVGTNMTKEILEYDAGWTSDHTVAELIVNLRRLLAEKDTLPKKSENALRLSERYDWNRLAQASHAQYCALKEAKT